MMSFCGLGCVGENEGGGKRGIWEEGGREEGGRCLDLRNWSREGEMTRSRLC